jgi:hypothetical protein
MGGVEFVRAETASSGDDETGSTETIRVTFFVAPSFDNGGDDLRDGLTALVGRWARCVFS